MVDEVHYFGYGANRDPKMMEAIIGRVPEGYPATIAGFELGVQKLCDVPENVRTLLSPPWDETFRSYVLRPATNYNPKPVRGMVWKLTRHERQLVDNWELTGKWYNIFCIQYEKEPGVYTQTEVQIAVNESISEIIHHRKYKTYLNNKYRMWKIARKLRTS